MTLPFETRSIVQLARAVAVPEGAFVPLQVDGAPAVGVPVEALFGKYLAVAVSYETAAELADDLEHEDRSIALVYADPDPANSVYWYKDGGVGAGGWIRTNIASGQRGVPGPANSTYLTTAELEAADTTNLSAILAEQGKSGIFTIRDYDDFTDEVAVDIGKVNYVRSTASIDKVWVRASILSNAAAQVGTADGGTVEEKIGEMARLADLAAPDAGKGSDQVNFEGKTIAPQSVEAEGDNAFGAGFDRVHRFRGRMTLGAKSGPMSFGDLQYCGIQNFGRYDIDGNYAAIQHTTDDSCALFGFFKARGTQEAPVAVVANDDVGELSFHAWDGGTFVKGALMTPIVKSVAAGIVSMSIRFWTMNSAGVLVNAVDIDETQKLVALRGIDAKWTTAGGSAFRAYYTGSNGGGAEIRTSNGFSATVPVYSFWFNNATGLGNPAADVVSVILNGVEKFRFDSGNFLATGGGLIGYGAGSGGTVTQATDKATAVTLHASSGRITLNNAALAAGAQVTFTLNNNKITANDIVTVMQSTGAATWGAYQVWAAGAGAGMVGITVKNVSGGSLSEAIVINFAIIKGATS